MFGAFQPFGARRYLGGATARVRIDNMPALAPLGSDALAALVATG
jgi:hypothetical protein